LLDFGRRKRRQFYASIGASAFAGLLIGRVAAWLSGHDVSEVVGLQPLVKSASLMTVSVALGIGVSMLA